MPSPRGRASAAPFSPPGGRPSSPPAAPPPSLPPQIKYSQLIDGLQRENIQVNRKILAELAGSEPYTFKALVSQVRFMRGLPEPPAAR